MKFRIIIFLLLAAINISGQTNPVDSLQLLLNAEQNKYERAKINLQLAKLHERIDLNKGKQYAQKAIFPKSDSLMAEASNQLGRFYFFTAQLDSAEFYFEQAKQFLKVLGDEKRMAIINISIGAIQLRQGDYNNTIKTLTESVSYFEKNNDDLNAAKCYSNMSAAFAELGNFDSAIEYNEKALQVFNTQNLTQFQLITLPNLAAQHLQNGDTTKAISYNLEAEKLAISMGNNRSLSIIYNNLGSAYLDRDPAKAKDYLEKTIELKNNLNLKSGIEVAQGNLGYLYLKDKDYKTALHYYKLVEQQVNGKQLVFAYNQLQKCYTGLKAYNNALEYSEKSRMLNDSILSAENQKVFNEIQTKYETEKKEKEIFELQTNNLEIDNRRIRNQNLLFTTLGVLMLTFFLIYVLLKNSKRKRILIQQELKIKNQELVERLKTQELNGIDAIIDAQEKERTRIANDLHDNLGSRIATLKLFINDIGNPEKNNTKEQEQLLEKLKTLADETYHEVREIAHNKYSGALINKGLIPSMNRIASQISTTEKLKVEIININVNQRIKNNIEIQVFRIIQELLTNIIKHASASEAIIQFSEDNNILNIMVEDNGKGFNFNKTKFGFGLTNIEKRVENINGNFVIDSTEDNGTTVILNIPI
ncbi:sensor histidine kinase [Draconibacterium sp.]|nr:sensor histidine kinase [Draconibacterium sp.]